MDQGGVVRDEDDGLARFRSEIAAFYAGFGQPELLVAAFEGAALFVPLAEGDRVFTSEFGGVHWVCAFTSPEELARYWARRGGVDPRAEYRYHTLRGHRLAEYASARAEPTGVMVDAVGAAPIAFPPRVSEGAEAVVGVL
ncbi:SseB family protein [Nocardia jiangxiensis]|uniref:SseB family protein n=1 Tax=Nocardia jiangxiensis TaxID=282685 RepID=A0ABW6RVD0_9NOCA